MMKRSVKRSFSWHRVRVSGVAMAAVLVLAMSSMGGCRVGGARNFSNENDRLRAQNLELERELAELEEQLALRAGELQGLRQQLDADSAAPMPDAEPPTLAKLEIERLSGPVDLDGDTTHDIIRIYLKPMDQRGRLLPVAGRVQVQAIAIPEAGDPVVVARREYDPPAFDAAWRSGFTGRHYTLELELPDTWPEALADVMVNELTVNVTLRQARTGATFSAQQVMQVRR